MTRELLKIHCNSSLLSAAFGTDRHFHMKKNGKYFPLVKKAMDSLLQKNADMVQIEANFIDFIIEDDPNSSFYCDRQFIIEYSPDLVTKDINLDRYKYHGFDDLELFTVLYLSIRSKLD